jgi:hypothetical protein
LAGNYNQNTYNSALYNAGREDRGGIIKSIIQAHTGPHIQAVVGGDPRFPANQDGVSFISDFNIIEGIVRKPPICYNFPDLKAVMRVMQVGQQDLEALLRVQNAFDMPACTFPVAFLPDLGAIVFGLFEKDLPAYIFGELARLDLPAILQIVQEDLGGEILGIAAPNLPASVFSQYAPDLGAIIWSPHDLPAYLVPVFFNDLPGSIRGFQFKDLSGEMLGIREPKLFANIKGFASSHKDLPAALSSRMEELLNAIVSAQYPGPNDMIASVGSGDSDHTNLVGLMNVLQPGDTDLKATIGKEFEVEFDLPAAINFLSATTIPAAINVWDLGVNDAFLPAIFQPVHSVDIPASIESNENLKNLGAVILSLAGSTDLGAFIRAAETFVTAILTISTLNAFDLRATIGNPACGGGSANILLPAYAKAQHAKDVGGFIQSFIEANLSASINPDNIFYTMDSITVNFTPRADRPVKFLTTDTIPVNFSPFRGLNLGAYIEAGFPNIDLSAYINPTIPLPRFEPTVSRIDAVELRPTREFDVQEIRLQMEGQLLDYFYVNGTDEAFIRDGTEDWKLNIRSFREIAAGLFGDFAAGRVCRIGNLKGFASLDEAVRACIASVIGLSGESDMRALLNVRGAVVNLPASLSVQETFGDLPGLVNRVFPVDFPASITGSDAVREDLRAFIFPTGSLTSSLAGTLSGFQEDSSLYGYTNATGGYGDLNSTIPKVWKFNDFSAALQVFNNEFGLALNTGSDSEMEYVNGPPISDLGISAASTEFTVSVWFRPQRGHTPDLYESIAGASGSYSAWEDGFGFYWLNSNQIRFWFNQWNSYFINSATLTSNLQWLHLVGSFDGTTLKFYINGVLQGQSTPGVTIGTGDPDFNIGTISTDTPSGGWGRGNYEDTAIWSRALTDDEVTEIFSYGLGYSDLLVAGTDYSPTDLELWWDFDETVVQESYPIIADRSGKGESGDVINGPVDQNDAIVEVIPVRNNVSMEFTSSNTYFRTTTGDNGVPITGTGSFSVMVTCRVGSTGFDIPVAAWNSSQTAGNEPSFRIKKLSSSFNNRTNATVANTGGSAFTADLNSISDTTSTVWYNWIVTWDESDGVLRSYQDGTLNAQSPALFGTRKDWSEFTIAAGRWQNNIVDHWQAEIDSVAVWDKVLSPADIDAIWNNGLSETDLRALASYSNIAAWYRLGEAGDTLSVLQDKSGNGHHMTRQQSTNNIIVTATAT